MVKNDEVFQFMKYAWNIARLHNLITEHELEPEPMSVQMFAPLAGLIRVDEDHAMSDDVRLDSPIIVVQLPPLEGKTFSLCVDGWHRIYKARQLGVEDIPGYYVHLTLAEKARIR